MRAKLQSMRFIARVLVEHCPLERAAWQTHEASEPTCFCHRPDEDADVRWLAWLARHDLTSAKVPGFTARIRCRYSCGLGRPFDLFSLASTVRPLALVGDGQSQSFLRGSSSAMRLRSIPVRCSPIG